MFSKQPIGKFDLDARHVLEVGQCCQGLRDAILGGFRGPRVIRISYGPQYCRFWVSLRYGMGYSMIW